MSKEINKHDIETLLQTKKFVDLSTAEQAFVLEQMSVQEYEHRQNILQASNDIFKETMPVLNPNIKENLLAELNKEKQVPAPQQALVFRLLNHPLPAWKAVAGIAALFLFFWLQPETVPTIIPSTSPETVHVYHTDTIYKEAKIVAVSKKKKRNYQNKKTKKTTITPRPKIESPIAMKTKTTSTTSPIVQTITLENNLSFTDTSFMQLPVSNGRSLKDEADLMDLFVELN